MTHWPVWSPPIGPQLPAVPPPPSVAALLARIAPAPPRPTPLPYTDPCAPPETRREIDRPTLLEIRARIERMGPYDQESGEPEPSARRDRWLRAIDGALGRL